MNFFEKFSWKLFFGQAPLFWISTIVFFKNTSKVTCPRRRQEKNTHHQNTNSKYTAPKLNTGTNTQFWEQRGFENLKNQERKSFWRSDFPCLNDALPNILWKGEQTRGSGLQPFSVAPKMGKEGRRFKERESHFNIAQLLNKSIPENLIHVVRIFKQRIINY